MEQPFQLALQGCLCSGHCRVSGAVEEEVLTDLGKESNSDKQRDSIDQFRLEIIFKKTLFLIETILDITLTANFVTV
jgi:hypothetical protein